MFSLFNEASPGRGRGSEKSVPGGLEGARPHICITPTSCQPVLPGRRAGSLLGPSPFPRVGGPSGSGSVQPLGYWGGHQGGHRQGENMRQKII
jgi:hypothetical protein